MPLAPPVTTATRPSNFCTQGFCPRACRRSEPAAAIDTPKRPSVAVVIRFVRTFHRHTDVRRLVFGQDGEARAELVEMQARDLLVEVLRQRVHLAFVEIAMREQLDL